MPVCNWCVFLDYHPDTTLDATNRQVLVFPPHCVLYFPLPVPGQQRLADWLG